jgi:hypothetical protein
MKIYLYKDESSLFDLGELKHFIEGKLPNATVSVRVPFLNFFLKDSDREGFAADLASARIDNQFKLRQNGPKAIEINMERRTLHEGRRPSGFYDGFKLMSLLSTLIPKEESELGQVHIVFTDMLFGTLAGRYHVRAIICSHPSLISARGLVEAPAKPRQYYLEMEERNQLGNTVPPTPEEVGGDWLVKGDERLTNVARGYSLQAIFYALFQEAFCEDTDCALFNAHWQEQLLHSQIGNNSKLCNRHSRMLTGLK